MARSILLVDDDPKLLRQLGRQFEQLGFTVVTAVGPDDAKALASDRDLALAVVDVILEDSLGLEVVKVLRRELPRLPIIMCSGFARFDWVGDLARQAAVPYIEKPTTARAILAQVGLEP